MPILNLPKYHVLSTKEEDHDFHIDAETVSPSKICLACGSENTVGGGRQEILIKDTPMYGKRVGIYVKAHRVRCRDCGKTHTERLPDVVEGQRMTTRLYKWIGNQSLNRTFVSIANDVGVSEGTVRSIFTEYVTELERTTIFETPQWMGMDEIHIIKKCRGVITNIEDNTVINLLPDRGKAVIYNYLMRLKGRDSVKCVTMDMWQPYKDSVYASLPNACIVIDKFHVLRMANLGLETIRKGIREDLTPKQRRGLMHDRFILLKRQSALQPMDYLTLESWTKNFPSLGEAYKAKERFFQIYDAMSIPEAKELYRSWKNSLVPGISDAFKPLTTAMENWESEIFNYFEHPVTNAYTECLNGLVRVINRAGRGYSFEALRAKILFTASAHKIVIPKFERRKQIPEDSIGKYTAFYTEPSTQPRPKPKNYGADVSTLERLLEEGRL